MNKKEKVNKFTIGDFVVSIKANKKRGNLGSNFIKKTERILDIKK